MLQAVGQRRAAQVDDALVAFRARPLVHGEGQIAGAEKLGHARAPFIRRAAVARERGLQLRRVESGIAAQVSLGGHVGGHQTDRAVALGLQGKDAVVFHHAGEHGGERQHLAEQGGERLRIGVPGDDVIGNAAQAHQVAPDAGGFEHERLNQVALRRRRGGGGLPWHQLRHQ